MSAITPELQSAEVIAHHLRLVGAPSDRVTLDVIAGRGAADAAYAREQAASGACVVAAAPDAGFCAALGVHRGARQPAFDLFQLDDSRPWHLRTLHAWRALGGAGEPVLEAPAGAGARWLILGDGGVLLLGIRIADDLVRYRQGAPEAAENRYTAPVWAADEPLNERPNYLFSVLRDGEPAHVRHADEWTYALRHVLSTRARLTFADVLPGGAPGAVVITGDDDQAFLEKYQEQLTLLGDTPITYFLHPLTRHDRRSLERARRRHRIDLGLHPDALDDPTNYAALFHEQMRWYCELVGSPARFVRNHGFLNDGYWGHLPSWLAGGCPMSSNIPGLDGEVINGSLLPARVVHAGGLSPHWSVLTAFGDGMVFVGRATDEQADLQIRAYGDAIAASGMPGVVVFNLHPQNIDATRGMHAGAMALVERGFVAWTMSECWRWFAVREGLAVDDLAAHDGSWWRAVLRRIRRTEPTPFSAS